MGVEKRQDVREYSEVPAENQHVAAAAAIFMY